MSLRVCLDPGHGGVDSGAVGPQSTLEKNVAWDYAQFAFWSLNAAGYAVSLTRRQGGDPHQYQRARSANDFEADYAIGCHANGFRLPSAHGAEVLYWHTSTRGRLLAEEILAGIAESFPWLAIRGAKPRASGARGATWLRETHMTAVIVEPGFVTNPEEEQWLALPATQKQIADVIVAAVIP